MSISGVNGVTPGAVPAARVPGAAQPQDPSQGGLVPRPNGTQAPIVTPPAAPAAEAERALSAQAPAGVDPALWSVLSVEERQFFSRLNAMGPLTYGPRSANVPPRMVRGGRLDMTV